MFRNIYSNIRNLNCNFSTLQHLFTQYESKIGLRSIYPTSSLDINKQTNIPVAENGKFSGYIPMDELEITYSKSSGPGGQNVNKVNSKVDMRFALQDATWLPSELKSKIREKFGNSINAEGYLVVRSERTRSQQLNLADALDKLRHMIHQASYVRPPPSYKSVEMHRRRQEKASRERLRIKRERSLVKRDRQGLDIES